MVAGQLGLKSSSPWVNSAQVNSAYFQSVSDNTYMYVMIYGLGFWLVFRTKSKINIKKIIDKHCNNLLIDRIKGELAT